MQACRCPGCDQLLLIPNPDSERLSCANCRCDFALDQVRVEAVIVAVTSPKMQDDTQELLDKSNETSELAGLPDAFDTSDAGELESSPLTDDHERTGVAEASARVDAKTLESSEKESPVAESPAVKTKPLTPAVQVSTVSTVSDGGTGKARRSRKGRNPVLEAVKVVLGGVAGLLIAQMILWWLPGQWRRDPFDLAPQLPASLAFLVPTELRSSSATTGTFAANESNHSPNVADATPRPNSSEGGLGNIGLNAKTPDDVLSESDWNDSTVDEDNQATTASDEDKDSPQTPIDTAPLNHQLQELQNAWLLSKDTSVDAGTLRTRRRKSYSAFCNLAKIVESYEANATSDTGLEESLRQLDIFVRTAARDQDTMNLLGVGGAGWLSYSKRNTDGIALAGQVLAESDTGKLISVKLAARNTVLQCVVSDNSVSRLGQHVVVLGIVSPNGDAQVQAVRVLDVTPEVTDSLAE